MRMTEARPLGESSTAKEFVAEAVTERGLNLDDFVAYLPAHSYICTLTREPWPAASVNARIRPVPVVDENGNAVLNGDGEKQSLSASAWLDKHRAVEQMTWAPGEPMLIQDRLVANGGWLERKGVTCLNLYRPSQEITGDASQAGRWREHIRAIYGEDETNHIVRYFAFKVQKPNIKINHGLMLGGDQGIGKDTICEPLKYAVGQWNYEEVSPQAVFGRFNGYIKSVIVRVSEVRDLGDGNRFDFYERMKTLTASPPDVLRCDEKHLREYAVFNVCGVIITTNYKTNGIYLPADDRRHYVAWSESKKEDFSAEYWDDLWAWYDAGGIGHVVAYLKSLDVSDFNPKAPPPKTPAFWAIVDANRSPEDAELADAIDRLGVNHRDANGRPVIGADGEVVIDRPAVITLKQISRVASDETRQWLDDPKKQRIIPHRLEACGYEPVRNNDAKDGLWKIGGRRQAVYGQRDLSMAEKVAAVERLKHQ